MMLHKVLLVLFLAGCTVGLMDNCRYHEFDCDSRQKCIPFEKHCDGFADCEDKTDEKTCVFVHSTKSPDVTEFNEEIVEFGKEESFGLDKIVIVVILVLLVSSLVGLLGFLYKKQSFSKQETSFNNPFYYETKEQVNEDSDEKTLFE